MNLKCDTFNIMIFWNFFVVMLLKSMYSFLQGHFLTKNVTLFDETYVHAIICDYQVQNGFWKSKPLQSWQANQRIEEFVLIDGNRN
jgi:hypothetical protein